MSTSRALAGSSAAFVNRDDRVDNAVVGMPRPHLFGALTSDAFSLASVLQVMPELLPEVVQIREHSDVRAWSQGALHLRRFVGEQERSGRRDFEQTHCHAAAA